MFDNLIFSSIFDTEAKKPALICPNGRVISYGELGVKVHHFGDPFPTDMRSLVFCMCNNTAGSVIGYLGSLSDKSVPLLLPSNMEEAPFEELYTIYQPAYLWAPIEFYKERQAFQSLPVVYTTEGFSLVKTGAEPYEINPLLSLLLTTSGSTGSPKLVRQSGKNILSNAKSIVEYLHITEKERPITTLPMHYTYGLSVINSHLIAGAAVILCPYSVMEEEFWELMEKSNATSVAGVPMTYSLFLRAGLFERDLPHLQTLTQAGGHLPTDKQRKIGEICEKTGRKLVVMYGQTEATARMAYLPPEHCLEKIGSIGIAIPGGKFELRDDNGGLIIDSDVSGELVYKGDNVTLGYAETPEDLAKGDERDGVLFTGDMAKRDHVGYYFITGRKKRFIKLAGQRVSLDHVEERVNREFSPKDCACVGTDDNLHIYVTGMDEDARAVLRRELVKSLRCGMKNVSIIDIKEIPHSTSGKTQYKRLK